ncbi:MAG: hypothetical protein GYA15_14840 [Leptolinea sp.]|nr:hypothetical protein [Leptolinea sp.]
MQPTVGEQLKQARIAKKASIDDVSRAVHIRPYFIEALEENRLTEIPSMAQARGFIRLYADWLQLSTTSLLDLLDGKPEIPIEPRSASPQMNLQDTAVKPVDGKANTQKHDENVASLYERPEFLPSQKSDTTSAALFRNIGNQLRSCREKLSISVEDIEKLTHIRARYLVDMEDGNFNDIPSLVQARGLLSGYAAFLNLDTDSLLGTFAEALQARRIELLPPEPEVKSDRKKKQSAKSPAPKSGLHRFLSVDFIVGSVTIIGLVLFGIWSAFQVMSSHTESLSKPPAIAEVLRQNPTSDIGEAGTTTPEPTEPARNPESIGQLPTSNPVNPLMAANESPTPPVPSLGQASMQVYIVPNQRVFLQVTTGKKVAFLGRTVPGNAYPFTSDERIEVLSGNAAALQIYYNQRDLGTLGLPGQPLRLIFNKEGVMTPTSAVTAAPTSTPLATLTLRPTATRIPPTVTPLIP